VVVTDAYRRRCAITDESTLPVLEAAHIRPFAKSGVNEVSNGILLRSDFHKLFDAGLVTVTPELRVEVSAQIKEQWFNGNRTTAFTERHYRTCREILPTARARSS
jgi:putative restriction endonuclease